MYFLVLFLATRSKTTCLADFLGVAFISIPQKLVRIASRCNGFEVEAGRDEEKRSSGNQCAQRYSLPSHLYVLTTCMCMALSLLCLSLSRTAATVQCTNQYPTSYKEFVPTPITPSLMQLTFRIAFLFDPFLPVISSLVHQPHHHAQASLVTTSKRSPP
jgi:hypothetical protein